MAGPESEVKSADERFGRYTIYGKIAAGGMASVYLARDEDPHAPHRWVAIKRVHPHLVSRRDVVQMFLNEAALLSRLTHPNICPIIDYGVVDGSPYIAMRYLHGAALSGLLRRLVEQKQPLPVNLMAWIAASTCDGLHYAHDAASADGQPLGLVHRDVSPQNIFITFDGGVRLLDFGVAKAAGYTGFTRTGHIKGKYAYMSPEQVEASPLDRRSDVFSLGIVLWESLAGRHLFRRKQHIDTLRAIARTTAPRITTVNPDVPEALAAIIARALTTDRRHRYQSAKLMGAELWAYLAREDRELGPARVAEVMKAIFPDRRHPSEAQGVVTQPEALGLVTETEARGPSGVAPPPADGALEDDDALPLSMPDAGPIPVETQPDVTAALTAKDLLDGPETLRPSDDELEAILERTRTDLARDSTDPEYAARLPAPDGDAIEPTLNDQTGLLLGHELKISALSVAPTAQMGGEDADDATVQLSWLQGSERAPASEARTSAEPRTGAEPRPLAEARPAAEPKPSADARSTADAHTLVPTRPRILGRGAALASEDTAEEAPFPVIRGLTASGPPPSGVFDPATQLPFDPVPRARLAPTATLVTEPLPDAAASATPLPSATSLVDRASLLRATSRPRVVVGSSRSAVVVTSVLAALVAFAIVGLLLGHDPAPPAAPNAGATGSAAATEPRGPEGIGGAKVSPTATTAAEPELPAGEDPEPSAEPITEPAAAAGARERTRPSDAVDAPEDPKRDATRSSAKDPSREGAPRDRRSAEKRLRARALESEARRALFGAGDRARAQRLLEDCLKLAELPACHRTLAVLHDQTGDRARSVQHYRRYLELAPDATDAPVIRRLLDGR